MIGSRMLALAAMAVVCVAPASAQVTLTPGQRVTVTVDRSGAAQASRPRAATPAPTDVDALAQMRGNFIANPPTPGEVAPPVAMDAGAPAPRIVPGQTEILFFVDGKDSVLALQNGYDRGLTYRATITARGQSGPTDVCLVMPGRRGYEHWPYVIDKIELSEFTLVDWSDDGPPPCR